MKRLILSLAVCAASGFAQPVIGTGGIVNVASYSPAGLPNSAIAEGSLFAIFGSGLGPAKGVQVSGFPLNAQSFQGTSVSATVNGTTVEVPVVFTRTDQVNALLPSNTPVGTGTLTLTYNGATSAPAPIQVVKSSFGIFSTTSNGSGTGAILDTSNSQLAYSLAAHPGDTVILYGTGLGPVTGNETQGPQPGNLSSIKVQVYVGSATAQVAYHGRSGCCAGEDQINFIVPAGVEGCTVPVAIVVNGSVVSNYVTIPVAASGNTCSVVSSSGGSTIPPDFLTKLEAKGTAAVGFVALFRTTLTTPSLPAPYNAPTTTDEGVGIFTTYTASNYTALSSSLPVLNIGACTVYLYKGQTPPSTGATTAKGLDAGTAITVNGPLGTKQLTPLALLGSGFYVAQLGGGAAGDPTSGPLYLEQGSYAIANGTGGKDVGAFHFTLSVSTPFIWTNQATTTTVNRAAGVTLNWTGGDPNGTVDITGSSYNFALDSTTSSVGASFSCQAPVSAGTFTVPPAVLLALPPSGTIAGVAIVGSLSIEALSAFQQYTAPGLDFGLAFAGQSSDTTVTYQ